MSETKKPYRIQGRPQTIYRVVKNPDNPYVMVDRRPIDNPSLSFKAKGILTYLLSRPDGWEVSVADLINHATDKEASVRAGLKELKQAGHMRYTVSRESGRITGWLIEVFEYPISPDGDFQQVEIQQVENLDVENQRQVLSTLSSTELSNTDMAAEPPPIPNNSIENQIFSGVSKIIMPDPVQAARTDFANLVAMWTTNQTEAYKIAMAFQDARNLTLPVKPETKVKGQRKAIAEMLSFGVKAEHVTEATRSLLEKNMTVADLFSVSRTAIDLANKPDQPKPEINKNRIQATLKTVADKVEGKKFVPRPATINKPALKGPTK